MVSYMSRLLFPLAVGKSGNSLYSLLVYDLVLLSVILYFQYVLLFSTVQLGFFRRMSKEEMEKLLDERHGEEQKNTEATDSNDANEISS